MSEVIQHRELKPEEAGVIFDPADFGFDRTSELEVLNEVLGQPRALKALDLGLGIRHASYNINARFCSVSTAGRSVR